MLSKPKRIPPIPAKTSTKENLAGACPLFGRPVISIVPCMLQSPNRSNVLGVQYATQVPEVSSPKCHGFPQHRIDCMEKGYRVTRCCG